MILDAFTQGRTGEADDAHSRPGDGRLMRLHPDRDPDLVGLLGREPVELKRGQQTYDGVGSLLSDQGKAMMLGDGSAGEHVNAASHSCETAFPQ